MTSKIENYKKLVSLRKSCDDCTGLKNPARCAKGAFDSSEIGTWTRWQGNLDSELLIVGQDWGDVASFQKQDGKDSDKSVTNKTLRDLLTKIGFHINLPSNSTGKGELFFTNAILCLKKGDAQTPVKSEWFRNCGSKFLKPQIEIVKPKFIICLGERAYETVLRAYGMKPLPFREAVSSYRPTILPNGIAAFAVYHCSQRIRNTHRKIEEQENDWQNISKWFLNQNRAV